MTALNSKVAEAVYAIENGKMSPAMACREYNVDPYTVEDARRMLKPGHRFNSKSKTWTIRKIWMRKSR